MRVQHLGAACALIETPDVRLLCDPWFTDGIYDGSWYHFPPVAPFGEPVDAIWVSHLHPDHYDPAFLGPYLAKHPARLLIPDTDPPHLAKMMERDGFAPETTSVIEFGETRVHLFPAATQSVDNIDSALLVTWRDESVVNMNDCGHDVDMVAKIHAITPRPSLALLPHSGAGPYPQAFRLPPAKRLAIAVTKRDYWLNVFNDRRLDLNAECAMPFAGEYVLGGRNAHLNALRGLPDACESLNERVIVLKDGGTYDLTTRTADHLRTSPYDPVAMEDYALSLAGRPMAWESLPDPGDLEALVRQAIAHAGHPPARTTVQTERQMFTIPSESEDRVHLWLDHRYLGGLLTRQFHWNNAEVGSNLRWSRVPDVYSWEFSLWLARFHV